MSNERITEKHRQKIYDLILKSSPEGVYQMVLDGSIGRFPRYFWSMPENYDWSAKCTRYLIEKVLKWDREMVCKHLKGETFTKYKLTGMVVSLFDGSIHKTLDNAYPDEFMPWELSAYSRGYFDDDDNCIKAVKWLIEKKLKWDRNQVCENVNYDIFVKHKLKIVLDKTTGGVYELLDLAYPNEFCALELKNMSITWGKIDYCNRAVRWVIEKKLKWTREDVCKYFCANTLNDNGLGAVLNRFDGSPYKVLNSAYPNEFMPWELKNLGRNFWNSSSNIKKAIRWLVEVKLGYNKNMLYKVTTSDFKNAKLGDLLIKKFNNSTKQALEFTYGKME